MYRFRQDINFKLKHQGEAAKEIGLTQPTLCNILSGKVACRKVVAYCITKYIDLDAEIEDYFVREGE